MSLAHSDKMKSLSLMTSKRLLLVKPSLFLPPLFPNSLARLPKRSGNSTLTRRFETIGPRQGLRVHARFVQQRLVTVHFIFSSLCSQVILRSLEGRRGGGQKEVVSYLLSTAFYMPLHVCIKSPGCTGDHPIHYHMHSDRSGCENVPVK